MPVAFFVRSHPYRAAGYLLAVALIGAGAGAVYLHNRSKAADLDLSSSAISAPAGIVLGSITDTGGRPLKGTLTYVTATQATTLESDAKGQFSIPNVTQPTSAQFNFVGSDGYRYSEAGGERTSHTVAYGQVVALSGWVKGSQVIPSDRLHDTTPPTITPLFGTTLSAGSPLAFKVTDNLADSTFGVIALYYRTTPTGGWKTAALSGNDTATPSTYRATIPAAELTGIGTVDYFITARDSQLNQTWYPATASKAPNKLTVATGSAPAAPSVTGVTPASGLTTGGTAVVITGTGFTSGTSVLFGGVPCSSVSVTSSSQVKCSTPAHAAGAVAVSVKIGTATGTKTGTFTYLAPGPAKNSLSFQGIVRQPFIFGLTQVSSGATITLKQGASTTGSAVTNSSGIFSFSALAPGTYTYSLSKTGYQVSTGTVTLTTSQGCSSTCSFAVTLKK
ncbi:MAG: IPT/TIG domain-containing protein [bacterium]